MLSNTQNKMREWMDSAIEFLDGQEWYQQLKAKWEELDVQSRNYVKFAAFGLLVLSIVGAVFSAIWSVHSLKSELSEKRTLLHVIQSANDEMRRLKDSTPLGRFQGTGGTGPWTVYFEGLASAAGFDKSAVTVSGEKAGASSDQTKEMLFEIALKHVNIKQITRYSFSLENGQRPVKVRNLLIDTKGDPSGYMDATLAVSGFTLVENQ